MQVAGSLDADTTGDVRSVLDAAFGARFQETDWQHCLGGRHVLAVVDGAVVGHAAVVQRTVTVGKVPFRAGYVEGVATHPAFQRRGIGTQLMTTVNDIIARDFELGLLSTGRPAFYERLGWKRWRGATFVRRGSTLERTPAEDDGILALPIGPSAAIALSADITCEERPGDDW